MRFISISETDMKQSAGIEYVVRVPDESRKGAGGPRTTTVYDQSQRTVQERVKC